MVFGTDFFWVVLQLAHGCADLALKSALSVIVMRPTVSALRCFQTSSSGLRSGENVQLLMDRLIYIDAHLTRAVAVAGPDPGEAFSLGLLNDGTWLVGAFNGLFRADAAAQKADPVPGANVGKVTALQRLSDGGWLVVTSTGLFRADHEARELDRIQGIQDANSILALKDGTFLLNASNGVFV